MGPDLFGPEPLIFRVMITVVPILVVGGFGFFFGSIIYKGLKNAGQPLLSREAAVVSRRSHVWGESSTAYYVTFEFQDGQREELRVAHDQIGFLAEGDQGILRSQGTAFKGFDRFIQRG